MKWHDTQKITFEVPTQVILDRFSHYTDRRKSADKVIDNALRMALLNVHIELTLDNGEIYVRKE